MRLLLVGTYPAEIFYPIGLLCLYSYVRARLGARVEIKIIENWSESKLPEVAAFNPDLIGISAMTPNYEAATKAATALKAKLPSTTIAIGGTHISLLPESFRRCFDLGVIGEGEDALCDLTGVFERYGAFEAFALESVPGIIFWSGDSIASTGRREPVDLSTYPALDYSILKGSLFIKKPIGAWGRWGVEALMETSRGCPYRCIFCATTRFWRGIRYFPTEWVTNNILNLIRHGCTHIQLCDDLFACNKKRLEKLTDAFLAAGITGKVELACSARTNIFDADLCELLKRCGCTTVFFGFESGNQRVLRMLKGKSCDVADNERVMRICQEHGMECWGSVMLGSPTETPEEMMDTIALLEKSKRYGVRRVGVGVTVPYPGTPLWDEAKKMGVVSERMDFDVFGIPPNELDPGVFTPPEAREEFGRIARLSLKASHWYKWNKAKSLFLSDPIRTLRFAFGGAPWWAIRRMFDWRMP